MKPVGRRDAVLWSRVRVTLLEWNPIEFPVPPDEYDDYVPQVIEMLRQGCTSETITRHLSRVRDALIGTGPEVLEDWAAAEALLAAARRAGASDSRSADSPD